MIIKILIIVILVIVLICLIIAVFLARLLARPKIITIPKEIEYEKEHGMWKNYDDLYKEEYVIKSFDGYELNTIYVPAAVESNKYVIISHGYGGCRLGSVKYLHIFRDLDFNCIMYDDRGHGDNKKAPCTMGYMESQDLMKVIDHVYERFGKNIYLGLHGESMGSALSNNALKYNPDIKFIISDCGYNDLNKLLKYLVVKNLHLPAFFAYPASLFGKLFYGYYQSSIKPVNLVAQTNIPICFIHGGKDTFIPPLHAEEMYKAKKESGNGYCELHIFPNAGHAYSVISDEAKYREVVGKFLAIIQ